AHKAEEPRGIERVVERTDALDVVRQLQVIVHHVAIEIADVEPIQSAEVGGIDSSYVDAVVWCRVGEDLCHTMDGVVNKVILISRPMCQFKQFVVRLIT